MLTLPSLPSPRPPCSEAERRAAQRLHAELRRHGAEAWVEAIWLRPQWLAGLAIACVVTAVGGVLALSLPAAGAIVALAGAAALAVEASGRASPARAVLPRRATQDVLVAPEGDGPVTMLVCAACDTGRAGWAFGPRAERLRRRRPRAWLAATGAAVAACAAVRWAGVDAAWLGWLQALPTLALLAGVAAAIDAGLAGWAPDAGEAAAAGVAIAVYDELIREPPGALAPGIVFYGAAATGAGALRARLRQERMQPQRTVVLELVAGKGDTPGWRASTRQLRDAAGRTAAALELPPSPPVARGPAIGRVPSVRMTVAPDGDLWTAVDLALGIVDAVDAEVAAQPVPA